MKIWVVCLSVVAMLSGTQRIQAQSLNNPGFMGKTQSLSVGTQVSLGLYAGVKTQALFVMNYEQSIRRDKLIQLRYTAGVLNVPFEKQSLQVDGPGGGAAAEYSGTLDFGNTPTLYSRSFGVKVNQYLLSRGALAPFGMYLSYGGEYRQLSAMDSFNQMVFVEENFNDPAGAYRFAMPTIMPRPVQSFNVLVGIGNKRFIDRDFFIDYQFGMTWMFWSNSGAYYNYNYDDPKGASFNAQNATEMEMRRNETRRQLFTLNITTGMVF